MKILCIGEMLIDFTPVTGMVNGRRHGRMPYKYRSHEG